MIGMPITFSFKGAPKRVRLSVLPIVLPYDKALTQADMDWIGEELNRSAVKLARTMAEARRAR